MFNVKRQRLLLRKEATQGHHAPKSEIKALQKDAGTENKKQLTFTTQTTTVLTFMLLPGDLETRKFS